MTFLPGSTYHFKWDGFELLAIFEGHFQGQPMFCECKSGLRFSLHQAGTPQIEEYDEATEALNNYKPDLKKFAPKFMGFREKQK